MDGLIAELKDRGVLRSPALERALQRVDRADFVPAELRRLAYADEALPLGWGATISQPYTVVFMLELLVVLPGARVLDVGSGSGWQSALLAALVGESGRVYALEVVPEIFEMGRSNLAKYPELAARLEMRNENAAAGWPAALPDRGFDRLIAAAAVIEVPPAWREQVKTGGRRVYPQGHSVVVEEKLGDNQFTRTEYPGFVFVPFVEP